MNAIPSYEEWTKFEYFPELGYSLSREIPLHIDALGEFESYLTIAKLDDGLEVPLFHLRTFKHMTAQVYKRFRDSIATIEARFPYPIYAYFYLDNPRRERFALSLGWEKVSTSVFTDGLTRSLFKYDRHLTKGH